MKTYQYLVFSNCRPGTDDAFNRWYDERHLADVLAIPGFESAARMRLAPDDAVGARHRYLAIYTIRSDDVKLTLTELMARAGTDRMMLSDTLEPDVEVRLYEVITPERTAL